MEQYYPKKFKSKLHKLVHIYRTIEIENKLSIDQILLFFCFLDYLFRFSMSHERIRIFSNWLGNHQIGLEEIHLSQPNPFPDQSWKDER